MPLAIELIVCVVLVAAIPAVVRFARRMSKGQAAGAMMAIGFVFATIFEGKPPQTTEETGERLNKKPVRKKGTPDQV